MITKSRRYREILTVLARHGIGVADDEWIKHESGDQARAEHLRRAFEELGTMFIKLGQILSTPADLLPDAYCVELTKLQDEVAPVPAKAIADVIREDLGAPPEELFAFFDPEPLGSASIGQVHAARLFDGRDVVLKVRKPGVEELVRIDLEIVASLIDVWSPRFPGLTQYDACGLLRDFRDALLAELDYAHEAANVKFFRGIFANENGFTILEVIEKYSTNRVLTEERIKGKKISDVADVPKRTRPVISRRIARFVLEPAFEHGIFYADPHPGNLFMENDGSLSVIDCGKIGRLTPTARRCAANLFLAIARSDGQRLADSQKLRFEDAIGEVLQLVRRHGLRLPGTFVLFFKALAMCEGMLQTLDPDSSFTDYLVPMVQKLIYHAFAGPDLLGRLGDSAADAAELIIALPRRIDRVLGEIEQGNLRVWTRVEDIEPLMKRLEHLVARSNATLLAAACSVGLAVVMGFYRTRGLRGWTDLVFWIAVAFVFIDYIRTLLTLRRRK